MNKFFTYSDNHIITLIYPLDKQFFWSRLYEYPFCLDKANKNDICLDIATGTYHPFKYALLDKCKEVYACDIEDLSYENLNQSTIDRFGVGLDKSLYNKVNFNQCNIISLPYSDNKFDSVFAISCLEHMDKETILQGLKELKRVLKFSGRIYVTIDYPTLHFDDFIALVDKAGLKIDGKYDYTIPENAITSDYFGERLYCYSIILKR